MSGNKILLVEDDQNFGDVLKSYLEMHDYDVTLASDGIMGFESYRTGSFDLCIFDVMMPRKDGFTLAREVREKDKEMPIIFLTAKNLKEDILEGFKIGADDYLSKPFNSEELLLRIQAILRRVNKGAEKEDEVETEKEQQIQLLEKAMETLNDEQRITVQLFYIEGKSYVEITEITGFDFNKVKSAIQNGKRNLKIKLSQSDEFKPTT